jgi:hypothetical protein
VLRAIHSARKIQRYFRKKFLKRLQELYYITEENMDQEALDGFRIHYGKNPASAGINCAPSPEKWLPELSNSNTTFYNENTSAKRVGSVSSYPSAVTLLPSNRSRFSVVIDECPYGNNSLTFGLAKRQGLNYY